MDVQILQFLGENIATYIEQERCVMNLDALVVLEGILADVNHMEAEHDVMNLDALVVLEGILADV